MLCWITKGLELVAPFLAACVKGFREGSEIVRELRADVRAWQKKYLELQEKLRAADAKIETLTEKLTTAYAAAAVLPAVVVWSLILSKRTAFSLDLLALAIVFGNPLRRLLSMLGQNASDAIERVPSAIHLTIQRIRQTIPPLGRRLAA